MKNGKTMVIIDKKEKNISSIFTKIDVYKNKN